MSGASYWRLRWRQVEEVDHGHAAVPRDEAHLATPSDLAGRPRAQRDGRGLPFEAVLEDEEEHLLARLRLGGQRLARDGVALHARPRLGRDHLTGHDLPVDLHDPVLGEEARQALGQRTHLDTQARQDVLGQQVRERRGVADADLELGAHPALLDVPLADGLRAHRLGDDDRVGTNGPGSQKARGESDRDQGCGAAKHRPILPGGARQDHDRSDRLPGPPARA